MAEGDTTEKRHLPRTPTRGDHTLKKIFKKDLPDRIGRGIPLEIMVRLKDKFKILKNFKTGSILETTGELPPGKLYKIGCYAVNWEEVELINLENGLTHIETWNTLINHYKPASALVQTLHADKPKKYE